MFCCFVGGNLEEPTLPGSLEAAFVSQLWCRREVDNNPLRGEDTMLFVSSQRLRWLSTKFVVCV